MLYLTAFFAILGQLEVFMLLAVKYCSLLSFFKNCFWWIPTKLVLDMCFNCNREESVPSWLRELPDVLFLLIRNFFRSAPAFERWWFNTTFVTVVQQKVFKTAQFWFLHFPQTTPKHFHTVRFFNIKTLCVLEFEEGLLLSSLGGLKIGHCKSLKHYEVPTNKVFL